MLRRMDRANRYCSTCMSFHINRFKCAVINMFPFRAPQATARLRSEFIGINNPTGTNIQAGMNAEWVNKNGGQFVLHCIISWRQGCGWTSGVIALYTDMAQ